MGILESIRKTFGGTADSDQAASAKGMLSDAGIDPAGLDIAFEAGALTVSGEVPDESERQRVLEVLGGAPGITGVEDRLVVAEASPGAAAVGSSEGDEEDAQNYTVKSGDTLWQIARKVYGDGSRYMEIFDANADLLEQPDRVRPGQRLRIPRPED